MNKISLFCLIFSFLIMENSYAMLLPHIKKIVPINNRIHHDNTNIPSVQNIKYPISSKEEKRDVIKNILNKLPKELLPTIYNHFTAKNNNDDIKIQLHHIIAIRSTCKKNYEQYKDNYYATLKNYCDLIEKSNAFDKLFMFFRYTNGRSYSLSIPYKKNTQYITLYDMQPIVTNALQTNSNNYKIIFIGKEITPDIEITASELSKTECLHIVSNQKS